MKLQIVVKTKTRNLVSVVYYLERRSWTKDALQWRLTYQFDRRTGSVGIYSGTANGEFAWSIGYRCPKEPERNPDWKHNKKALGAAKNLVEQWNTGDHRHHPSFTSLLARSQDCNQLGVYTQSKKASDKSWSRGRMVIGGDAAHTVLPLLGEGAYLAMADAIVLARHVVLSCLAQTVSDPETAV